MRQLQVADAGVDENGDKKTLGESLSVIQQTVIMKKNGAKIELWDNLRGVFVRGKALPVIIGLTSVALAAGGGHLVHQLVL